MALTAYADGYFAPDSTLGALSASLFKNFKKRSFRSLSATVALSGDDLTFKIVELPDMPQSDINSSIGFKLGADVEHENDTVISYYRIPEAGTADKKYYFTVSAKKKNMERLVKTLKKAGVSVREIIPYSCALRSAFPEISGQTCILMDCGKNSTIILLLKYGVPVFAREVAFGSDNIEQALTGVVVAGGDRIEISREKAADIIRDLGIPEDVNAYSSASGLPAQEILSMVRPALEKLGAEVLRTMEYYRNQTHDETDFGGIYISGPVASTAGFAPYITKELGRQAKAIVPSIDPGDMAATVPVSAMSVAAGAAIASQYRLMLLPEEIKNPFAYYTKRYLLNIYALVPAYAAILLLIYIGTGYYMDGLQKELTEAKRQGDALGLKPESDAAEKHFVDFVSKYGDSRQGDGFVDMMNYLDKNTPQGIYFDSIKYRAAQSDVALSGIILKKNGKGAVTALINGLKESSIFTSVDLSSLSESDMFTDPVYEFVLNGKLLRSRR